MEWDWRSERAQGSGGGRECGDETGEVVRKQTSVGIQGPRDGMGPHEGTHRENQG